MSRRCWRSGAWSSATRPFVSGAASSGRCSPPACGGAARPGDKWHADEVVLKINGKRHYLWRAVDQDGTVLDILVQPRRNQEAAEAFLRRVLDGEGRAPRVVVTDNLA